MSRNFAHSRALLRYILALGVLIIILGSVLWFVYRFIYSDLPVHSDEAPRIIPGAHGRIGPLPAGKLFSILPPGGLGEEIRDLAEDAQGRLWVATHIGLGVWDGEGWIVHNTATSSLPHDDVRAVVVAPDGQTVWVGTANGIVRVVGGDWMVFDHENSALSSPVINDLEFDREGILWAATDFGGVAFYVDEKWAYYDKYNSGLMGLSVTELTCGPDGRIWMVDGFGNGVSMFDGREWFHFTQENSGLLDNWVEQIVVDGDGRVWFVSDYEMSVLDGERWNPFDLAPVYESFFFPRRLAQGPRGWVWVAGVRPDGAAVYRFTLLGLVLDQVQEYLIPAIVVPEGTSFMPFALFLDAAGNPVDDVEEYAVSNPRALLVTYDGAWLGTSYGLFRLYNDGRVESIPLPNPQPPERRLFSSTGNPTLEFVQVYEFHPYYIRINAIGTLEVQNNYTPDPWFVCDESSGPSLYNPRDVTEFVISENIALCAGADLSCSFRPIDPPVIGERFTYWMSEVVNRLPHLHTPHPIKPEQEFHFGLSAPQPQNDERWMRVLAFPLSADITQVHGTPPTAEVIVGDWRLFVYDVSESYRPHINFVLHDDVPALSLEAYLEAAGWYVAEPVND